MASSSPITNGGPRPQHGLFISHKHRDREIADVLRRFLTPWGHTVGLEIFQSSTFPGEAPKAGKYLADELRKAVSDSSLLVLIYTLKNLGYETCILECGIALDPALPQTNVVVLKCTSQKLPEFLDGMVYVDARDVNSVKNFVRALFTEVDYFAGSSHPFTDLDPSDGKVAEAGDELFKLLQSVLPADQDDEQWYPVPFLQLALPLAEVERLRAATDEEMELARQVLGSEALEVSADMLAGDRVFEMAETVGRPLKELLPAAARQERVGVEMVREVIRAGRGALPAGCTPIVDRFGKTLLPSLSKYERTTSDGRMLFHFFFVPLEVAAEASAPAKTISDQPAASDVAGAAGEKGAPGA